MIDVIQQENIVRDDGSKAIQQNIKLEGLKNEWKGKEFFYYGISNIDVLSNPIYKVGDKVWVNEIKGENGESGYYIFGFVRRGIIYFLGILFSSLIIFIGRKKGFRLLISLAISFLIITKFIIPKIILGSNLLFISLIGCTIILSCIIYLTEGLNKKANLAIISILISLFGCFCGMKFCHLKSQRLEILVANFNCYWFKNIINSFIFLV